MVPSKFVPDAFQRPGEVTRRENGRFDKVAVVIVDPWNYHWCMTACERVSAMVPRWNRALECARKLGSRSFGVPATWLEPMPVGLSGSGRWR